MIPKRASCTGWSCVGHFGSGGKHSKRMFNSKSPQVIVTAEIKKFAKLLAEYLFMLKKILLVVSPLKCNGLSMLQVCHTRQPNKL